MGGYKKYSAWATENKEWVAVLDGLKESPYGFSFTEKVQEPQLHQAYTKAPAPAARYLFETRHKEFAEDRAWYRDAYPEKWGAYQKGFAAYLDIGRTFLAEVTSPGTALADKHGLLAADRGNRFLLHNAAVLWLEHHQGADLGDSQDYEEVLKVLWLRSLVNPRQAPGDPLPALTARESALYTHLLGRDPGILFARDHGDLFPAWNDGRLPGVRRAAHVTLGKVLLWDGRAVPDGVQAHPGSWGLFLVSPLHNGDRGFYTPEPGGRDDAWVRHLSGGLGMADGLFRHRPDGFQAYEVVPRPYGDRTYVSPGIYLHRSKAHGRDDFLTLVPAPGEPVDTPLVFCTKGVGCDPALIGASIKEHLFVGAFQKRFTAGPTAEGLFPFTYPPQGDSDNENAGSWRNIGFGSAYEGDEAAATDFANFNTLHGWARESAWLREDNGFVAALACVEISSLERNRVRMPDLLWAVDGRAVGYPAQVVTASPVETSLRFSKDGGKQDYDLGHLRLDVAELSRCYRTDSLPASVRDAVRKEAAALAAHIVERYDSPYAGTTVREIGRYGSVGEVAARVAFLEERTLLAFAVIRRAFASWKVFLDHGWASDSYTGSFSGRNFNSGPRDSNEWGPLDRPSERQEHTGPAGDGPLCLDVDISNLAQLLCPKGDLYKVLGLLNEGAELSPETSEGFYEDASFYEAAYMATDGVLSRTARSVAGLCGSAMREKIRKESLVGDPVAFLSAERIAGITTEHFTKGVKDRKGQDPLLADLLPWWGA
ncbi:hypothetical protein [Nocardiopsis flavescens]